MLSSKAGDFALLAMLRFASDLSSTELLSLNSDGRKSKLGLLNDLAFDGYRLLPKRRQPQHAIEYVIAEPKVMGLQSIGQMVKLCLLRQPFEEKPTNQFEISPEAHVHLIKELLPGFDLLRSTLLAKNLELTVQKNLAQGSKIDPLHAATLMYF